MREISVVVMSALTDEELRPVATQLRSGGVAVREHFSLLATPDLAKFDVVLVLCRSDWDLTRAVTENIHSIYGGYRWAHAAGYIAGSPYMARRLYERQLYRMYGKNKW